MELVGGILFFTMAIACSSIKFVIEHERLVVFRLGRAVGTRGPGPVFILPVVDRFMKVDLRQQSIEVPVTADTADNVTVDVTLFFVVQVEDAYRICTVVDEPYEALEKLTTSVFRKSIAVTASSDIVSKQEQLVESAIRIIGRETQYWGLSIKSLQIGSVELRKPLSARGQEVGIASPSGGLAGEIGTKFGINDKADPKQAEKVAAKLRDSARDAESRTVSAFNLLSEPPVPHSVRSVEQSVLPVQLVPTDGELPVAESAKETASTTLQATPLQALQATPAADDGDSDALLGGPVGRSPESLLSNVGQQIQGMPIFAMPLTIQVSGLEGLGMFYGTISEKSDTDVSPTSTPTPTSTSIAREPAAPVVLSSHLAAAVTGHIGRTCRNCEAELEGLLCFQCWELN